MEGPRDVDAMKDSVENQVASQPSTDDAVKRDPDQLHDLVVEYSEAVFRLAASIVRDRALAEDVTQETMVKAWLALPSFRGEGSLRGWIFRIAHNTAISALRSQRALVVDPTEMPEPDLPEASVEEQAETKEAFSDFLAELHTLDDLSRSIVVLREIEGFSYQEISEILEIPLPTVKTRLLRSRRRLSNALKEWSHEDNAS